MVEKDKFLVVVSVLTGMKLDILYSLYNSYSFGAYDRVLFGHVSCQKRQSNSSRNKVILRELLEMLFPHIFYAAGIFTVS